MLRIDLLEGSFTIQFVYFRPSILKIIIIALMMERIMVIIMVMMMMVVMEEGKKFELPKKSNFFPLELFSSKLFLVHMEAEVLQHWQTTHFKAYSE